MAARGRTDMAMSEAQSMIDALDRELAETATAGTIRITSPVDGQVAGIDVRAGQAVGPGTPLLKLLPDAQEVTFIVDAACSTRSPFT